MRNKVLPVLVLSLFTAFQSKAQVVLGITEKVADIYPTVNDGSYPLYFASHNNDILFSAVNSDGRELWKTDGTTAGTVQIMDLNPGPSFSSPRGFKMMNGDLYFIATNGTAILLWKTDGTTSGTQQIGTEDIQDGIYPYNSLLLFSSNGPNGYELWTSDGTASGTSELIDLNPGSNSSYPAGFTPLGTKVIFGALTGTSNYTPCITDGTVSGTEILAPVNVYGATSGPNAFNGENTTGFCAYNGEAYFAANDGTYGFELWKTDGTPAGTVMVKDIAPAADASMPNAFKVYNGKLYFSVNTGNSAIDGLWVSSGTAATTTRLKAGITMGDGNVIEYAEMNGKLYFIASNKVWVTDGTMSGTRAVLNSPAMPHRLSAMNDKLYCFGIDNTTATFTLFQLDDMENVIPVSFPMSGSTLNQLHTYSVGKYIYFGIAPATSVADVELYRFKDTTFIVGVNEVQAATAIDIYPNPATNSFSVKNVSGKNVSAYVYSLNGQLLLQSDKADNIDVSALPAGIYTVQIISDGVVSVGKLRKE